MTRLLLVAATFAGAAFLAAPAQATSCDLHCTVAKVCGADDSCHGVQRCYYWTDYPTCIYP
ncbi:MAG: hypothetical protein QOE45_2651 [Frankiaceae bacterium]|jgi:hypothetical protein|nr:hypothetical protein [Frankiaceae bacterium]